MQYDYEIKDKFGDSGVNCIAFYDETMASDFIKDFLTAIKILEPVLISSHFLYDDIAFEEEETPEPVELPFDCIYWDSFDLKLKTNVGQFEVSKMDYEDLYIYADDNQDCLLEIDRLLSEDVNFCKNTTPKPRYARDTIVPAPRPQDYLPHEDYSSYSVQELFVFIGKIKDKMSDELLPSDDFAELLEIAGTLYDKGNKDDRERLLRIITLVTREYDRGTRELTKLQNNSNQYSPTPRKRRRKINTKQPELF
jgi:hypothetical protein